MHEPGKKLAMTAAYPTRRQFDVAYQMMREGMPLHLAAQHVGCMSAGLDRMLWRLLGERLKPMFVE